MYEKRNAAATRFFVQFEHDPIAHAKILADGALRCEIRRIKYCSNIPYILPEGLREPKPEPVDIICGPLEYLYRVPK